MIRLKNGKRLTSNQRKHIETLGLNSRNWFIVKNTSEEWHLVHRETGTLKIVPAPND